MGGKIFLRRFRAPSQEILFSPKKKSNGPGLKIGQQKFETKKASCLIGWDLQGWFVFFFCPFAILVLDDAAWKKRGKSNQEVFARLIVFFFLPAFGSGESLSWRCFELVSHLWARNESYTVFSLSLPASSFSSFPGKKAQFDILLQFLSRDVLRRTDFPNFSKIGQGIEFFYASQVSYESQPFSE